MQGRVRQTSVVTLIFEPPRVSEEMDGQVQNSKPEETTGYDASSTREVENVIVCS